MALQQRIEALRKRHADLDHQIRQESSRPFPDEAMLHRLKAQKLIVKDDINRLMEGEKVAA